MSSWRLLAYVAALAAVMVGLVAMQRFTEGGLHLLEPTPMLQTLGTSEYSIVEWLQVVVLLVAAALAASCAHWSRTQRSLAIVLAATALAAACRELDFFLDVYLFDHAWQVFAAMIGVGAIVHGLRNAAALRRSWVRGMQRLGLPLIVLGVAVLIAFAAVIGSEGLWLSLLGEGYQRVAKIAAEELGELVGYWLWLCGQIEFTLDCYAQRRLASSGDRRRRDRRSERS